MVELVQTWLRATPLVETLPISTRRGAAEPREGSGAERIQLLQVEQPGLTGVHPIQHAGQDLRRLPDELGV